MSAVSSNYVYEVRIKSKEEKKDPVISKERIEQIKKVITPLLNKSELIFSNRK